MEILIMELLRMNMDMVFQPFVRWCEHSSCLDNADQMGEGWSDWIALMMQIKPGDFGGDKRGIGTLFLHKLQMVRV
jgi:hypothetical protein